MQKLRWNDLKTWQKVALIDIALIEVGLFAAVWVDLGQRLPEHVRCGRGYGRDWPNLSWREHAFLASWGIIIVEIGPILAWRPRLRSRLAQSVFAE